MPIHMEDFPAGFVESMNNASQTSVFGGPLYRTKISIREPAAIQIKESPYATEMELPVEVKGIFTITDKTSVD